MHYINRMWFKGYNCSSVCNTLHFFKDETEDAMYDANYSTEHVFIEKWLLKLTRNQTLFVIFYKVIHPFVKYYFI